jgi:hypothetical protein
MGRGGNNGISERNGYTKNGRLRGGSRSNRDLSLINSPAEDLAKGSVKPQAATRAAVGRLVLLCRERDRDFQEERVEAEQSGITILSDFEDINEHDKVIMRYFPFAHLIESEINQHGADVVISADEHQFLGNIKNWYPLLESMTPKTWFSEDAVLADSEALGPFFCKGLDKSLKHDFHQFCYAENRHDLKRVVSNLRKALPGDDQLCIRQHMPLKSYGIDLQSGMPLAHEFRCFIFMGEVISSGFYWKDHADHNLQLDPPPQAFLETIIDKVGDRAAYYTADVALTAAGDWILIELNNGGQAGLMGISPAEHYRRMQEVWTELRGQHRPAR